MRKTWGPEAVAILRSMHSEGCTPREMSDAFGTTLKAIYRKLQKLGLSTRRAPKMGQCFVWDEKAVETLKKMLADKHTFSEIGRRLGITRNAALGKAHRLGLQSSWRSGPGHINQRKRLRQLRRERQKEKVATSLTAQIAIPKRSNFNFKNDTSPIVVARAEYRPIIEERAPLIHDITELSANTCRWPIGEVGKPGFGYCGCEPVPGLPYCADHSLRAYDNPRNKRVNAAPVAAKEKEVA